MKQRIRSRFNDDDLIQPLISAQHFKSTTSNVGGISQNFVGSFSSALSSIVSGSAGSFGNFGNMFTPFVNTLFPTFGFAHHSGGMVGANDNGAGYWLPAAAWANAPRAHGGMNLAPDERPIIAQTGERVLSRRETAAYNSGRHGGGVSYRGGDIIIQGNADKETVARIESAVRASEVRMKKELARNFGQYQSQFESLRRIG